MLTHANNETIQHLQTITAKIKIIDFSISMLKTHECKAYVFFKMHKIVFHFYEKKTKFQSIMFSNHL